MQTEMLVKNPESTPGRKNNHMNKPTANKKNVRTTDYKKLLQIMHNDPDTITKEEFTVLQSAIGFLRAVALREEAIIRKKQRKSEQNNVAMKPISLEKSKSEIKKDSDGKIGASTLKKNEKNPLQMKKDDGNTAASSSGMQDNLRAGLEELSGIDLSDVKVHQNSDKPQQVGALAYTQGNDIHIAPGQEKHLPHEGWHAVQQKQGRVAPTMQMKSGTLVNDDAGLEKEADVMGRKAVEGELKTTNSSIPQSKKSSIIENGKLKENNHSYILQKMSDSKKDKSISFGKYKIGEPSQPAWNEGTQYDEDFKYDPKAKVTAEDKSNWRKWGFMSFGADIISSLPIKIRNLPDAVKTYDHYRSAKGTDLTINYEKAYKEDEHIRNTVNKHISDAQKAAEGLFKISKKSSFKMTGQLLPIGGSDGYPVTENWQKAVGAHFVWISADVTVDNAKFKMITTVHEIDRYNFNKGMSDIKSGTPDEVNGRFAVLGWAKSFNTVGKMVRVVTWNKGDIENSSTIKKSKSGGKR
jgi:hypothetical protein